MFFRSEIKKNLFKNSMLLLKLICGICKFFICASMGKNTIEADNDDKKFLTLFKVVTIMLSIASP